MKFTLQFNAANANKEPCHVVAVFQGKEKEPICSVKELATTLKDLAAADVFKGAPLSSYFFRSTDPSTTSLLLVGLGKASEVSGETLRNAAGIVAKRLESEKIKRACVFLDSFKNKDLKKKIIAPFIAETFVSGAGLALYSFDNYKAEKAKRHIGELAFFSGESRLKLQLQKAIDVGATISEAVGIARDLSNEPGNFLSPMELAKRATKYAKEYGLSCKVLDLKALVKEKMGGLIGVGQGSANPPCLIVMEYKPTKKARKTIALVGKGVTFDSGGISIKPSQGMEDMKHDMSGAADVIGATILAAKLKSPNRVICIVAAAENMPDGNAIVPSTILYARSGKTIEVQNTDAEGRLILADALDYAQDMKPDAVIDVATLTGAVIVALGTVSAGIMGNDKELTKAFQEAADAEEEKFWELPLYQEYSDDLKSKIADIKNIGGEKGAGSSKGGAFLKAFIRPGVKWLHVDIAGTAWSGGSAQYNPKHGASGHSVRTLARLTMDF